MLSSEVVRRFETQDGVTRTVTRELFSLARCGKVKQEVGENKDRAGKVEEVGVGKGNKVVENETGLEEMKVVVSTGAVEAESDVEHEIEGNLIDFD